MSWVRRNACAGFQGDDLVADFESTGEGTGCVVAHTETSYTTCRGFCDMKEAIPREYYLITQLRWQRTIAVPASPVVGGLWRIGEAVGGWTGKVL